MVRGIDELVGSHAVDILTCLQIWWRRTRQSILKGKRKGLRRSGRNCGHLLFATSAEEGPLGAGIGMVVKASPSWRGGKIQSTMTGR